MRVECNVVAKMHEAKLWEDRIIQHENECGVKIVYV
jgi:hypothetical protein